MLSLILSLLLCSISVTLGGIFADDIAEATGGRAKGNLLVRCLVILVFPTVLFVFLVSLALGDTKWAEVRDLFVEVYRVARYGKA